MVSNLSNTNLNVIQTPLQQKSGVKYAITSPITTAQQLEIQEEKNKKTKKLGMKIGGTVLAVGLAALGLSKGLPKNARTKINEFMHTLEEKTSKLSKKANKTTFENLYYQGLNKVKSATNLAQGACNFTPLKDTYFKNLLTDRVPFLKKFCDSCDNFFQKLSVRITRKSYSKTANKFDDMYKAMQDASKGMDSSAKKEISGRLKKLRNSSNQLLNERNFAQRVSDMSDNMNDLNDKVWGELGPKKIRKFFGRKDSYTTFLSETLAAPAKMKAGNIVSDLKDVISVSTADNTTSLKKILQTLDSFTTNKTSAQKVSEIRKVISEYSKTGDTKTLNALLKEISGFSRQIPDVNVQKEIAKSVKVLGSARSGQIQDLMALYKKTLPAEEYAKLQEKVNKALKSLDTATNKETNLLFDKIRDIKIGSIFTDLGGLLLPIATAGVMLGKADGKDEKSSVALKYGIPAVGAVSVCLLCTVNLISGLPALAIGLGSGWVMNKIGAVVDNARKNSNAKKAMAQNGFMPTLKEKIQLS